MEDGVQVSLAETEVHMNHCSRSQNFSSCCKAVGKDVVRYLLGSLIFLSIIAAAVFTAFSRHQSPSRTDVWKSSVPWVLCTEETGAGSARHELFLNRLNGRRIVFVGDCILRCEPLPGLLCSSCLVVAEANDWGSLSPLISWSCAQLKRSTPQTFTNGRHRFSYLFPI
jgi:hypothetical protein